MFVAIQIPDKRITDLLHGHGGSYSPWLHELSGQWTDRKGFYARWDKETDNEGDGTGKGYFSRAKIRLGLSKWAMERPQQYADFMLEGDDDITFDSVMQYIIFGKEIYG